MNNKYKPIVTEKSFKENIHNIINNPHNAIVELIANAHDAGATEIHINWDVDILNNDLSTIKFEDNGCGMSNKEFKDIWIELSYDRLKKTNKDFIEIKTESDKNIHRKIYGRNGKGRHAPFAFSTQYSVKTIHDGECSIFEVCEDSQSGFSILEKEKFQTDEKNGTTISFKINKIDNNMSIEDIKETIATRFLKDEYFKIYLNNNIIELEDISDDYKSDFICTYKNKEIKIIKIKSNNRSSFMKFHGISWKFANRIFTENWDNFLDGRLKIAKKYNFIISAEFLSDFVNETMSGFKQDNTVEEVKKCVYDCILNSLNKDVKKEKDKEKKEIIKDNFNSIKKLGIVDKKDVVDFINEVQEKCPNIKPDDLKATSEIFIKLKESHNGYELLHKLAKLSSDDYDKLDQFLQEWDIHDAKVVLDLIKSRLDMIDQLKIKVDDPNTDEVHELQPLFTKGLWIFGPEFESIEFTSNRQLCTVVHELFKKKHHDLENPLLRPDFVVVPDQFSVSFHSSYKFDENHDVSGINKLLIVELKKSGAKIDLNEYIQAQTYVKQLIDANHITKDMTVEVYILGSTVNIDSGTLGDNVKLIPMSYHTIIARAESRLFNLRDKIKSTKNITGKTGDEIFDDVMIQDSLDNY